MAKSNTFMCLIVGGNDRAGREGRGAGGGGV